MVVTNPDTATTSLTSAFSIEQGRAPDVSAFLVGPSATRLGISRYFLTYNNRGNINSPAVDLRVTLPKGLLSAAAFPVSPSGAPAHLVDNGDSENIQLYLRDVPANSSGLLPLQLRSLNANNGYEIGVTSTISRPLQTIVDNIGPLDPTAKITGDFTENTAQSFKVNVHVNRAAGNFDIPTQMSQGATGTIREPSITITEKAGLLTIKYEATVSSSEGTSSTTNVNSSRVERDGPSEASGPDRSAAVPLTVLLQTPGRVKPDGSAEPNYISPLSVVARIKNPNTTAKERALLNDFLLHSGAIHTSDSGTGTDPKKVILRAIGPSLS